jgi:ankyrin repeat protein
MQFFHVVELTLQVNLLNENGAVVCELARRTQGNSSLHVAAKAGHLSTVREMIRRKADVNLQNSTGKLAIHLASDKGHLKITELLLEAGSKVSSLVLGMDSILLVLFV